MLSRKELRFERRSILTAAQLRAIEKFPREILRLMFLENGDGIISGLDYVERGGEIFLTEGLVKIGGTFYFAAETNLSALMRNAAAGAWHRIILGAPQRTAEENVVTEKIELEVRRREESFSGLEFGTFKAGLVYLPAVLEEFTLPSRLNLLEVPYSVRGGSTFHPLIFRAILSRLERKKNPAPSDTALSMQLAANGIVSIPALKIFVESKGVGWRGDSRENIFSSVARAVDAAWEIILPEKISAAQKISTPPQTYSSIILDDDD